MPIYEYRCSSCAHQQEFMQKLSDPLLTVCTKCGQPTFSKMLTAAGFQLKGSGWYVTDFKNKSTGTGKAAGGKTGEAGGEKASGSADNASGDKAASDSGSTKSSDSKSSETKSGETKSGETKSGETKSGDAKSASTSPPPKPSSTAGGSGA